MTSLYAYMHSKRARAKNTANYACATLFFTQRNPLALAATHNYSYSGKRMHNCYLCTATVKSNRFIEVSSPFICYPSSLSHCIIVGLITWKDVQNYLS